MFSRDSFRVKELYLTLTFGLGRQKSFQELLQKDIQYSTFFLFIASGSGIKYLLSLVLLCLLAVL